MLHESDNNSADCLPEKLQNPLLLYVVYLYLGKYYDKIWLQISRIYLVGGPIWSVIQVTHFFFVYILIYQVCVMSKVL